MQTTLEPSVTLSDRDVRDVRRMIRTAAEWLDGQHDDEAIAHGCQPRPYSMGAARGCLRVAELRLAAVLGEMVANKSEVVA